MFHEMFISSTCFKYALLFQKFNIYYKNTVGCTFVVARLLILSKISLKQNFNNEVK